MPSRRWKRSSVADRSAAAKYMAARPVAPFGWSSRWGCHSTSRVPCSMTMKRASG
ncbi:Uncharacterised protein [Bordetella pertussis]|nr:Uncharacterised protein [Bordetella pertussis]